MLFDSYHQYDVYMYYHVVTFYCLLYDNDNDVNDNNGNDNDVNDVNDVNDDNDNDNDDDDDKPCPAI